MLFFYIYAQSMDTNKYEIAMKKKMIIGCMMLISFSVCAETAIYNEPAPLGLTWGMSFNDFQKKTNFVIKPIDKYPSTCPMTAITFDEIIDGKKEGNYKVYFYKKFKELKFTGLYGVVYSYETNDLNKFKVKDNNIIKSLDSQYSQYKKVVTTSDGGFLTYDANNIQRSYFSSRDIINQDQKVQYKKNEEGNYDISVSYFFYPEIYSDDLSRNIKEIRKQCNASLETD